jgi:hypothetical protein
MGEIKDRTAAMPFILFVIFAGVVGYCIYKGTKRNKVVEMKEDVLYVAPKSSL